MDLETMKLINNKQDYVLFDPADYVENPVALMRIKARITQEQLARRMKVTQAYVARIEKQKRLAVRLMSKVNEAIGEIN